MFVPSGAESSLTPAGYLFQPSFLNFFTYVLPEEREVMRYTAVIEPLVPTTADFRFKAQVIKLNGDISTEEVKPTNIFNKGAARIIRIIS